MTTWRPLLDIISIFTTFPENHPCRQDSLHDLVGIRHLAIHQPPPTSVCLTYFRRYLPADFKSTEQVRRESTGRFGGWLAQSVKYFVDKVPPLILARSPEVEMGEIFLSNIFNENGQVPSDIPSDTKNSIRVVH